MITLALDKRSYRAGEELVVFVTLAFEKPVKARGLYATLFCTEKKVVKITRQLDEYDYQREKELGIPRSTNIKIERRYEENIIFRKEQKLAGEGEYTNQVFQTKFTLPKDARPTSHELGHDNRINIWKIDVKLDIPFAPDQHVEQEVYVERISNQPSISY